MASGIPKFFAADADHGSGDAQWLQLLLGDWQIAADLMAADLVLWLRRADEMTAVGHARPGNGTTVYYDDPVGSTYARDSWPELFEAWDSGQLSTVESEVERDSQPAFVLFAPVRHEGRMIAVVTVESFSPFSQDRIGSSNVEQRTLGMRLLRMMGEGTFPIIGAPVPPRRGAPRVQDGLVSLDENGRVTWASPNALSAFHRFGIHTDMTGESLAEFATGVLKSRSPVDESLPLVLMGRAAWRADMQSKGGTISLRAVPLTEGIQRIGAILLVRDVTELRRRERELITKDATIREVHHRVKNNLQTVAALLRLQARRISSPEAKEALLEAMRRVSTIALVHETLLQGSEESVRFDDVIERCLRLAVDAASATVRTTEHSALSSSQQVVVKTEQRGKAGIIRAEQATPLALVVAELATNAVEHGLSERGGTLSIISERTGSRLIIHIDDDGTGMDREPEGLGTNIAQTLLEGELSGTLRWYAREEGGTRATVDVELDPILN